MERFDAMDWIPGLPMELGMECLSRLPHSAHQVASGVCKQWRELIQSPEFYSHRHHLGYTRQVACLVQALPPEILSGTGGNKRAGSPSYLITVFDPMSRSWERLAPVPGFPDGLPLFCQLAGCQGKLVVMGGWDPKSYNPVSDVFVYDFTTGEWRVGSPMPSKRSFFTATGVAGRVCVAGGHDENKNALRSAWAYDPRRDEWAELPPMTQERDECEGLVVNGSEFWVVSGYSTDQQGAFDGSAEVYEPGASEWRRVDNAWEAGRCPKSCVGIGRDGKLLNWSDSNSDIRVGACGIGVGKMTILTGSEYQGAPERFYVGGQDGKLAKIGVPEEFAGFVQSGCCVDV